MNITTSVTVVRINALSTEEERTIGSVNVYVAAVAGEMGVHPDVPMYTWGRNSEAC